MVPMRNWIVLVVLFLFLVSMSGHAAYAQTTSTSTSCDANQCCATATTYVATQAPDGTPRTTTTTKTNCWPKNAVCKNGTCCTYSGTAYGTSTSCKPQTAKVEKKPDTRALKRPKSDPAPIQPKSPTGSPGPAPTTASRSVTSPAAPLAKPVDHLRTR